MKKILPFFSYAFHPIFISVMAALFYFTSTQGYFNYETMYLYIIQILIITVFIPLASFYLLVSLQKIDSIMVTKVEQRKIPLFLQSLLLSSLIFKSITIDVLPELFYFYLGSIISTFLALILALFHKKASLHMLGISSLTVFCMACSLHFQFRIPILIAVILLINGLVASSRLYMKAHTVFELTLGYTIGALPQLILLLFWL